jgi:3'-phosphoadenosine 5'-phosphosulfate sulfotransferase (PAPS reductase)/FAD synthetase
MMKEMAQIRGLAREHGDELAFVVNHSGEKDSARMLGLVCKKFPILPHMRGNGRHRI